MLTLVVRRIVRLLVVLVGVSLVTFAILHVSGDPVSLQLLHPAKHYGQSFDEMTTAVVEMVKELGIPVALKPLDFAFDIAHQTPRTWGVRMTILGPG